LLNSGPEIPQHPLYPKVQPHSFGILAQFGFPADEVVFNALRGKFKLNLVLVSPPSGVLISLAEPG
jgi:hypothetical protein